MSDVVRDFNMDSFHNFEDLDDITLSQALDKYELCSITQTEFDDVNYGVFEIESDASLSSIEGVLRFIKL